MSVSSNELKKGAFRPLLPDVYFIKQNDFDDLQLIDDQTACVILETVQGDAGIRIPDEAYIKALRKKCTDSGAMLILDEIQCGMGRTGTMFAFEQFDVVPDILVLGKALAGGLPVGCFVSSRENMQQLTVNPMLGHISTFAGHPVVCAAVAATLKEYRDRNIVAEVKAKGEYIASRLRSHPLIREVRHRGLFFAIDLQTPDEVQKVVSFGMERGLISFWFLSCPASFRIAPPLITTYEEIDKALAIILDALNHASGQ